MSDLNCFSESFLISAKLCQWNQMWTQIPKLLGKRKFSSTLLQLLRWTASLTIIGLTTFWNTGWKITGRSLSHQTWSHPGSIADYWFKWMSNIVSLWRRALSFSVDVLFSGDSLTDSDYLCVCCHLRRYNQFCYVGQQIECNHCFNNFLHNSVICSFYFLHLSNFRDIEFIVSTF